MLIYHSTLRLIEGLLSPEDAQKALELGYLNRHPSGHWVIPHGEARKRILVHVLGTELVCGLCGGPIAALEEATQDHIIPISQGGPDALANVQLAHRACNELKGNALPEQYPPFFPRPGDEAAGWYERTSRRARNGRGGRYSRQRGYGPAPAAAFQAQPRDLPGGVTAAGAAPAPAADTPAGSPAAPQAAAAGATAGGARPSRGKETKPPSAAANGKSKEQSGTARANDQPVASPAKEQPATAKEQPAMTASKDQHPAETGSAAAPSGKATTPAETPAEAALTPEDAPATAPETASHGPTARETVREDPAWLAAVQRADLPGLQVLSREAHWATRTASLRTLEQLPAPGPAPLGARARCWPRPQVPRGPSACWSGKASTCWWKKGAAGRRCTWSRWCTPFRPGPTCGT